jgi:hypothetical protein
MGPWLQFAHSNVRLSISRQHIKPWYQDYYGFIYEDRKDSKDIPGEFSKAWNRMRDDPG